MATATRNRRVKATDERLQTLVFDGRQFVVVERTEYDQLRAAAGLRESDLPPMPKPDAKGNVNALEYSRASLARKIFKARRFKGWTQQQLADAAGVRIETINRLERGKNTPDLATMQKIEKALG